MANLLRGSVIGRLTRDPHSGNDRESGTYALLSLAVNRKVGDGEETEYVDISVRGKQAESCAEQLSKGDEIYVDGNLALRQFERNDKSIDKVLKLNANTVQFLKVQKWDQDSGGSREGNSQRHDSQEATHGRSNGTGRSYGRSGTNASGTGRRARF
jgi:single-strand DNA-binding protein